MAQNIVASLNFHLDEPAAESFFLAILVAFGGYLGSRAGEEVYEAGRSFLAGSDTAEDHGAGNRKSRGAESL